LNLEHSKEHTTIETTTETILKIRVLAILVTLSTGSFSTLLFVEFFLTGLVPSPMKEKIDIMKNIIYSEYKRQLK